MKLTNDFKNQQGIPQDPFAKTAAYCIGQRPDSGRVGS